VTGPEKRIELTKERARRLLAKALSWVTALEGKGGATIDPERDRLLEDIDLLILRHSPTVRAQRQIILAVVHARRYAKPGRPVARRPHAPGGPFRLQVHNASALRSWVESFVPGALGRVDDPTIERAVASTPKAKPAEWPASRAGKRVTAGEQAMLELLAAAGVPLRGVNPAATIRKHGYSSEGA